MHVQNLKIFAEKFGLLFIKNGKKSVTKDRVSVIYKIIVLQVTATQYTYKNLNFRYLNF